MKDRRKAVLIQLVALLLLLFLSAYRQIDMHHGAASSVRYYIVYIGYLLLVTAWGVSLRVRVTQKNLCLFLSGEAALMAMGVTIRFVQDAFLQENILLLRFTGYLMCATLPLLSLLGFWSSLGLGQGEGYHLPKRWYLLSVPVITMTALLAADEKFHFVFRVLSEEIQPNINFHPNFGLYLIIGMTGGLIVMRAIVIYRRNRIGSQPYGLSRLLPLAQIILLVLFTIPYVITSFSGTPELVEFFAGIYYLEALSWELYILAGLVPINMEYIGVFGYSTVGMQILYEDGRVILRSQGADSLTDDQFERLSREGKLILPDRELTMHRKDGYCFVWHKDVHQLRKIIDSTEDMERELSHEGALLQQEIRARAERARVDAQNRIYGQLSEEVAHQLTIMRELVKKCRAFPNRPEFLHMMLVLGTYIKQRCNLRLIEQEEGCIRTEDICLSFQSMAAALRQSGTECTLAQSGTARHSAEFWIGAFDQLEELIEQQDFRLGRIDIAIDDAHVSYRVRGQMSRSRGQSENRAVPYRMTVQETPDGYLLEMEEANSRAEV